jgi:large subunit ribosomal protein L22
MEARAKLRYARLSPRKTRLVVDMVRGKGVQEALNILRFSPQKAAGVVGTLVSSAVANAEQKGVSDVDRLFVKSISGRSGTGASSFHAPCSGTGNENSQTDQPHNRGSGRKIIDLRR